MKEVVIYARYSSESQRPDSCDDQARNVRGALARLEIDASSAMILQDEAQSGTRTDRDQFQHLCRMVARGEVALLAVDDQARLSRADNVFAFVKDLVFSGGRFISTTEGIDTNRPGWELLIKVTEIHHSATIRNIREGVRRGQEGRVRDDGSAGDFPFGFESYYLDPDWAEKLEGRGPKPKKGIRICEAEADWVRQVFVWFTEDRISLSEICRRLTDRKVPKDHRGTVVGWHHQQVRRMLSNPKYIGEWTWGATTTIRNSKGRIKQIQAPAGQTVHRSRPKLIIIDQATWDKAQTLLSELRAVYGMKPNQKRRGSKPHGSNLYPQSLLGGLLFCGVCGSRMYMNGSGDHKILRCPNHRKGLCEMASHVPAANAEKALIELISGMLTGWPEWMQGATAEMRRVLAETASRVPDDIQSLAKRLTETERRCDNLVNELADGTLERTGVRAKLLADTREADELRDRLTEAEMLRQCPLDLPDDKWVAEQIGSLTAVLENDTPRAALLLRKLLGRVKVCSVIAPGKRRGYARLLIRLHALETLRTVLRGRVSDAIFEMAAAKTDPDGGSPEFAIDLGEFSKMDTWAPKIADLRRQGVKWVDICQISGLNLSNAHKAWKRWMDSDNRPSQAG